MVETLEEIKSKFNAKKSEYIKSKRPEGKEPIYNIRAIPIDQIVSQKTNMNSLNSKSFQALIQSILNTGYTMPVNVVNNLVYDPSTKGQPIPDLLKVSDGNETMTNDKGDNVGTQVSDDEVAKYFPYRLIDGAHRSLIIRLGKDKFEHGFDNSEKWAKGEEIPEIPGDEALAYIAWKEDFKVPCVLQILEEDKQLSSTVLLNSAKGSHDLDSMKNIVYSLITDANMSEEWISRNLYIDITAIKRMMQLVGMVTPVSEHSNDFSELSWVAEKDERYKKMYRGYVARQAEKFLIKYQEEHPDWVWPKRGDMVELANSLGYSREKEFKDLSYKYSMR